MAKEITHAKVKYIGNNDIGVIDVKKIAEFQENPPNNVKDFNKKKIYTTLNNSDDEDKQTFSQGVQISALARGSEECIQVLEKRSTFPPLDYSVLLDFKEKIIKKSTEFSCDDSATHAGNDNVEEYSTESSSEDETTKEEIKKNKKCIFKDVKSKDYDIQKAILDEKIKNFLTKDNLTVTPEKSKSLLLDQVSDGGNASSINTFNSEEFNELKVKYDKLKQERDLLEQKYLQCNKKIMDLQKSYKELQLQKINECENCSAGTSKKSKSFIDSENDFENFKSSTPKSTYTNHENDSENIEITTPKSVSQHSETSDSGYSILSHRCKKKLFFERKHDEGNKKIKLSKDFDNGKDFKKIFIKTSESGTTIKMISLGNNLGIPVAEWENAYEMPNPKRFTKMILRSIYSKEQLTGRSIAGDPSCKTPKGINTRKQITPIKHKVIRRCLCYYLQKKMRLERDSGEYKKQLDKMNSYLTEEINYTIQIIKKQGQGKNEKNASHES